MGLWVACVLPQQTPPTTKEIVGWLGRNIRGFIILILVKEMMGQDKIDKMARTKMGKKHFECKHHRQRVGVLNGVH